MSLRKKETPLFCWAQAMSDSTPCYVLQTELLRKRQYNTRLSWWTPGAFAMWYFTYNIHSATLSLSWPWTVPVNIVNVSQMSMAKCSSGSISPRLDWLPSARPLGKYAFLFYDTRCLAKDTMLVFFPWILHSQIQTSHLVSLSTYLSFYSDCKWIR